ncbi:MAG TPA: iron ABC transporter permease [Candidatus Limnocylindria bacterium]|nr:iron ABC transporter permease [Candidatus Limnocylindria bacterium]
MPVTRATHLTRARLGGTVALLAAALALSLLAAVLLGPVPVDLAVALGDPRSADHEILVYARLPRVLLAAVVGAALGAAGSVLQGLLGNPLADPNLLGVSAGAAVAGAIAIVAGADPVSLVVPWCAFAGALATVSFVYAVARTHGRTSPHAILLVGVVCNALAASIIMLVNALASYTEAQGVLFWIMGALSTQSYTLVGVAALYVAVGSLLLVRYAAALNLLATGEEGAAALGVDVDRVRRAVFVLASLLVGAAVSVSGMINFVGLIVPHLLRLVVGPDQRLLLPASVLGGAAFLVWADAAARTALAPAELPVGVVTALLGGPFFLYLLRRSLRGER